MIKKEVIIGGARLLLGDCLEILPTLPSFEAIITDPPYGRVKGDFDKQWLRRTDMLGDVEKWIDAIAGKINKNGTLWWFAYPSLAGQIEALIAKRMSMLAHVVWRKNTATQNKTCKEALRAPAPTTERILMAEHLQVGLRDDKAAQTVFEPLRAYFAAEFATLGWTANDLNRICKTASMAGRHFTARSQWCMPTESQYALLQQAANGSLVREYGCLKREHADLKREYESLRRYFDCRHGDQFSDIWDFNSPTSSHGHPTEKPLALMEYLVKLSVRPGATCCDPFLGSGTTGVAALRLGRKFVGIEKDEKYFDIACNRIGNAFSQGKLFSEEIKPSKQIQIEMI